MRKGAATVERHEYSAVVADPDFVVAAVSIHVRRVKRDGVLIRVNPAVVPFGVRHDVPDTLAQPQLRFAEEQVIRIVRMHREDEVELGLADGLGNLEDRHPRLAAVIRAEDVLQVPAFAANAA